MKLSSKTLLLVLFVMVCQNTVAQSYIERAKALVILKQLWANKTIDQAFLDKREFAESVMNTMQQGSFIDTGTTDPGVDPEGFEVFDSTEEGRPPEMNNLSKELLRKRISNAKTKLIAYLNEQQSLAQDQKSKACDCDKLQELELLTPMAKALTSQDLQGEGTVSGVAGALLGVTEAEILLGITEWAISRAEEELMQAFLRDWLETINNDPILKQAFPNLLNMLSTSDLTAIYTDGVTWKATFKEDFDALPDNLSGIARSILERHTNMNINEEKAAEIIASIEVLTPVFQGVIKNTPPDQIIRLQGETSFLKYKAKDKAPVVHRSMVGLDLLLKMVQKKEADGALSYIHPNEIIALTEEELRELWELFFCENKEQLEFAFHVDHGKLPEFGMHAFSQLSNLKIELGKLSENLLALSNFKESVQQRQDPKLSAEELHTYSVLVLDLVETGLDFLENFVVSVNDEKIGNISEQLKRYKKMYSDGFSHIAALHSGIKTQEYGKVALQSVNLLLWIKNNFDKEINSTKDINELLKIKELENLVKTDYEKKDINALIQEIKQFIAKNFDAYPETKKVLRLKVKEIRKQLNALPATVISSEDIKKKITQNFTLSETEVRSIVKEIAEQDLADLQFTSEALNRYGALMASIILAESSEDVKNILSGVANKTGGYMVRQKSVFSATVSFYPGVTFGKEEVEIDGSGQNDNGTFFGASLPIGIEFAIGLDAKPIGAVGVMAQLLDLGAVLNYSLGNDNEDVGANPEFGFQQVFSPGLYLTLHPTNNPITLGLGASYSPDLREITANGITVEANALQYGLFLGVDLNVFTLFASDKKRKLAPKSLKTTYE